eukprot:15308-Chlamydomonas_euryale.AAC.4
MFLISTSILPLTSSNPNIFPHLLNLSLHRCATCAAASKSRSTLSAPTACHSASASRASSRHARCGSRPATPHSRSTRTGCR